MGVTFSSVEHDGLGRYHDPISPGADLQQLRNLQELLLKPAGSSSWKSPPLANTARVGPVQRGATPRRVLTSVPTRTKSTFRVLDTMGNIGTPRWWPTIFSKACTSRKG